MDERALGWTHLLPHNATFAAWNVPPSMRNLLAGKIAGHAATWLGWQPRKHDLPALDQWQAIVLLNPRDISASFLRAQGFASTQSFAVMPGIQDPRWFVSLQSPRTAQRAWDMYTPFHAQARFRKGVAQWLTRAGLLPHVSNRLIVAQRAPSPLAAWCAHAVGQPGINISISSGTPGPRRKWTLQLVSPRGGVVGYAKYGDHAATGAIVQHEAQFQTSVQARLRSADVPQMLHHGPYGNGYIVVSAPITSYRAPEERTLTPRHMAVLFELSTYTGTTRTNAVVDHLQRRVHASEQVLDAHWRDRLRHGLAAVNAVGEALALPTAAAHGDWAPWNMCVDRRTGKLIIFDWEYGRTDQVWLADAFHFVTQVDLLVHRRGARESVTNALATIQCSALAQQLQLSPTQVRALYTLYLIDACVQWFEEHGAPHEVPAAGPEQAQRGEMLDVVLAAWAQQRHLFADDAVAVS